MCSLALFLRNFSTKDHTFLIRNDGILGHLECSFWNQGVLIWGGFLASTYNLLCLTIERYIQFVNIECNVYFSNCQNKLYLKMKMFFS